MPHRVARLTSLAPVCASIVLMGCAGTPRSIVRAPSTEAVEAVEATDRDHDGYADACDGCPDEAETRLDRAHEDGCPGTRPIALDELVSFRPVRFSEDVATWLPEHDAQADELARFIAEHPTLRGFRLIGHASPGERRAEWLAAERARVVREQLIERGVPERILLVVSGVGASPLEFEALGMDALRTVTFEILEAEPPSRCPG